MRDVAALQDAFQTAILDGDDAVLSEILDGPLEARETLFGVYRNAYSARLVEILGADFPALKAALGEEDFDLAARAYVAAHPSTHRNARWVGRGFAPFLGSAEPWSARAELSEIASFETALADAFDAADADPLTIADLAAVPPDEWGELVFAAHPSVRRLDLSTNAVAIWEAAANEEEPPPPSRLETPEKRIVWRDDATPMYRALSDEEAMLWDEAARGARFGQLCVIAATYDEPDAAAGRAAGYLAGWINAGVLAGADRAG